MRIIRLRPLQIRPSEETPSPVAFARGVALAELVVVDGAIGFVQRVRAIGAAVIG
jgi:hypothetical protein